MSSPVKQNDNLEYMNPFPEADNEYLSAGKILPSLQSKLKEREEMKEIIFKVKYLELKNDKMVQSLEEKIYVATNWSMCKCKDSCIICGMETHQIINYVDKFLFDINPYIHMCGDEKCRSYEAGIILYIPIFLNVYYKTSWSGKDNNLLVKIPRSNGELTETKIGFFKWSGEHNEYLCYTFWYSDKLTGISDRDKTLKISLGHGDIDPNGYILHKMVKLSEILGLNSDLPELIFYKIIPRVDPNIKPENI